MMHSDSGIGPVERLNHGSRLRRYVLPPTSLKRVALSTHLSGSLAGSVVPSLENVTATCHQAFVKMAGKLWVPSSVLLLVALILSILVSLSLPYLKAMDISRFSSKDENPLFDSLLKEFRFGIWAGCYWTFNGKDNRCSPTGHGYFAQIMALTRTGDDIQTVTITPAWTRGLAAHPFATGAIAIALGASLSTRHTVHLFAPLLCGFAAVMILIAFAIQIALHLHVRVTIGKAVEGASISAGPGFWLTLSTLVLVLISGAIMFVNRRRELKTNSGYPTLSTQKKGVFSIFSKLK
ncbi:hypothetical protein EST38_g718 [Candolleomyces aberdarensis]|uniref:Pali-domain-containing protein n=1 Tax=Candolleomyces aberdarensis TaxID=2316362 RepID=A0A4Q2DY10_9AGAR|nr:hypothetical protein EST38_g718 [Candolleomyces aberdarensis]